MSTEARISRRHFIGRAAAAAACAPALLPAVTSRVQAAAGANDRVNVGCVGVGPRGTGVMQGLLNVPGARVVAVCDVKMDQLAQARALVDQRYGSRDCAAYGDFRELVARDDIDAVLVATPDHWHVLAALAAVRAGKDVYVEKPLGLSVAEDQALRAALRQHGRLFQFGTQQRSSASFRFACELVRSGRIGELKAINVWSVGSVPGGPTEPAPVPPGIDYDFWLGPAPFKPYRNHLCDADGMTKTWWFVSDYALGFIAGWGVHPIDIAYWGYPGMMEGPVKVRGEGVFPAAGACDTATTWDIDFSFASGVTMNYRGVPISANGGPPLDNARLWSERYGRTTHHGTAFEGTEGWIHVDRGGLNAHPRSLLEIEPDFLEVHLPRSDDHGADFIESVRSRRPPISNIDEAFQADLLCHLSELAIRLERELTWDPRAEAFINDAAANARLACRPMRHPWSL